MIILPRTYATVPKYIKVLAIILIKYLEYPIYKKEQSNLSLLILVKLVQMC